MEAFVLLGKPLQGWMKESKKQRKLLMMVIVLKFTWFFTNNPVALMYFAINYTCQVCRKSFMLRNIYPWMFHLDSLMLFPTNRSFRTGALLLSKYLASKPVKHIVYALLEIEIEVSTVWFYFFSFTISFLKKDFLEILFAKHNPEVEIMYT